MNLTFKSYQLEALLDASKLEVATGHQLNLAVLDDANNGWLDVLKCQRLSLFLILLKNTRPNFLLDVSHSGPITISQGECDIDHRHRKVKRIVLYIESGVSLGLPWDWHTQHIIRVKSDRDVATY